MNLLDRNDNIVFDYRGEDFKEALECYANSSSVTYGIHLYEANVDGADLEKFQLRSGAIENCELSECGLSDCVIINSEIDNSEFFKSNLADSVFTRTSFDNVVFGRCDLTHSSFEHLDYFNTTFRRCDLTYANFNFSNLTHTIFENSTISSASFYGAYFNGNSEEEVKTLLRDFCYDTGVNVKKYNIIKTNNIKYTLIIEDFTCEYIKEMTLEEIEEALGYKVRLAEG